jgi:hypothetical protein
VLSEAAYLLRTVAGGPAAVLDLMTRGLVQSPFRLQDEAPAVRQLLARYASARMDLADACLVRMTELHADCEVLTIDGEFRDVHRRQATVIPTVMPSLWTGGCGRPGPALWRRAGPTTGERAEEPSPREGPLRFTVAGDVQERRRFVDRQPSEEAKLDDLGGAGRDGRKPVDRLVESDQIELLLHSDTHELVEIDERIALPALPGAPASRVVDQYAAHGLCRGPVEMNPAPEPGAVTGETQVGFVHQRCRLERVIGALAAHLRHGETAKLRVHERHQLRERLGIAVAPPREKPCDVHARLPALRLPRVGRRFGARFAGGELYRQIGDVAADPRGEIARIGNRLGG